MILFVNGEETETALPTLGEVMRALGYEGEWLASAVNGELVHADERAGFVLGERDRIEILSPMQGG